MILGLEDSFNEIFVFNDNILLCTDYSGYARNLLCRMIVIVVSLTCRLGAWISILLFSNPTPRALDSSRVLGPDRLCCTRVMVMPITSG
jgi:hypothetical protein